MLRIRSPRDFLAGLLFLAFAGLLAWSASGLAFGTARRMGPGFFPMLLAVILGGFGGTIVATSLAKDGEPLPRPDWAGLGLVTVAIVAFGFVLDRWGFIAACAACVAPCLLATRPFRPVASAVFAVGLVAFCVAVFAYGLGLPVRLMP